MKKMISFTVLLFLTCSSVILPLASTVSATTYYAVNLVSEAFDGASSIGSIWVQGWGDCNPPSTIYLQLGESVLVVGGGGIFGGNRYGFDHWEASGGISISSSSREDITVSATGEGRLKLWLFKWNFELDVSPMSRTIKQGDGATYEATVIITGGWTTNTGQAMRVQVEILDTPLGTTENFAGSYMLSQSSPSDTHHCAIYTSETDTPTGTYYIKFEGTIESTTTKHSKTVDLVVEPKQEVLPDLIIEDFWWSPEYPEIGETVTFTYTEKNDGPGDASAHRNTLLIDGYPISNDVVEALAAGASRTRTFPDAWIRTAGGHEFLAVADDQEAVTESEEENNALPKQFDVDCVSTGLTVELSLSSIPPNTERRITISGRLTRTDTGAGIAERPIRLDWTGGLTTVTTSATGYYSYSTDVGPYAKGTYEFTARFDGYETSSTIFYPSTASGYLSIDMIDTDLTITLNTSAIEENTFVNVAISGRLTREDNGVGLGDKTISLNYGWGGSASATTEGDGYYSKTVRVSLSSGGYLISASFEGDEIYGSSSDSAILHVQEVSERDLIIIDTSWYPADPSDGDSVSFSYIIKNNGTEGTTDFTNALYIDGERIDISARRPLTAGETQNRYFTYAWTATEGSHNITVVADDLDEIPESHEGNNRRTAQLHVWPSNMSSIALLSASPTDVEVHQTTTFDGRGSYDPDGTVVSYWYDFGDGFDSGWTSQSTFLWEYTDPGDYYAKLKVKDNDGEVSSWSSTVHIHVRSAPTNQNPFALLSVNALNVEAGENVVFDASASYDPDGSIVSYWFDFGDGSNSGWTSSTTYTWAYSEPGTYPAKAKAKDVDGLVSEWSGTVEITVEPYEVLRIGLQALDDLEQAVLEGAQIVDIYALEVPVEALTSVIDFIPTSALTKTISFPLKKVVLKIGEAKVQDLLEGAIEGAAKVDKHYKYYLEGDFSSNMSFWKEKLLSLNSRFQKHDVEYLQSIEFIEDMSRYHSFLSDVGHMYVDSLGNLVETHELEESRDDLIFLGGSIMILLLPGAGFVIALGFNMIELAWDLKRDSDFVTSLCSISENQMVEALDYAFQVSGGLEYVINKVESVNPSFPKIGIIPVGDGNVWVTNEYTEPLNVKVVYDCRVTKEPVGTESTVTAITRAYAVPSEEIVLQPGASAFFSKPSPPEDIERWIELQAMLPSDRPELWYSLNGRVDINIVYGEDGLHAMKSYPMWVSYIGCVSGVDTVILETWGTCAGLVEIEKEEQKTEVAVPDVSIETEAELNRVTVKVSSVEEKGRTIAIIINPETLPVCNIDEVLVLYDGEEIHSASDYADVLNPNDEDVPEHFIRSSSEGIQVFVSIPQFSIHEITVTRVMPSSPFTLKLLIGIFALPVILLTVAVFLRRRRHPMRLS